MSTYRSYIYLYKIVFINHKAEENSSFLDTDHEVVVGVAVAGVGVVEESELRLRPVLAHRKATCINKRNIMRIIYDISVTGIILRNVTNGLMH